MIERATRFIPLFALLLVGACGSDDQEPAAEPPDTSVLGCDAETRAEPFTAGMAKTGAKGLAISLMNADPAPPARYDNRWTLQVRDSNGNAVDGATVKVVGRMPDHMHTCPRQSVVIDEGGGMYGADPVSLCMPGFWVVKVEVQSASVSDSVEFKFCVS